MPKYKKDSMLKFLTDKVNELRVNELTLKDITRSRIGIALLILENKSLKDITLVYGYNLESDLKWIIVIP